MSNNVPNEDFYKSQNNHQINELYSYSMINENYKPTLSSQNYQYQLLSSFNNNKINNINHQDNPKYKTLEAKTNITDDYYYKYTPISNRITNNLILSNNTNEVNNNEKILPSNIIASTNKKNLSLNSQISQEIDRQKLKFDEMVERAKNLNNSEIFEFDIKKYLPKESSFENSKALRKYKYLIKPNNLNKYNYYSSRNNYGKQIKNDNLKYDEIKDNSLSEIPIKNENLFEDELSKIELNFNLQSPNKENNQNNNDLKNREIEQNNLKQNLLKKEENNMAINNKNDLNSPNYQDNNINNKLEITNKNINNKLNNIINKSPNNSDICIKDNNLNINDEHIKSNLKDDNNIANITNINYSSQIPFFNIYYEKDNQESEEIQNNREEFEENYLNEIEKTNAELQNNKKLNINNNKITEFSWYCLDFFDDKQEDDIFKEFFNKDKI